MKIASFAMVAILAISGCETHQQPRDVGTTSSSTHTFDVTEGSTDWPYWPTTMRIHPLTRVMSLGEDGLIIEARIEFSDAHGSTTRGVGQLRLLLVEAGGGEGEILEEWNNDLREVAANVLHFDDITRTYLFRLRLDPANSSRSAELRAQFLSVDNTRLSATHRLRE